jgi:hypothetical protein
MIPGAAQAIPFERARDLPLPPGGRSAIVFIRGHETETRTLLGNYYAHARFERFGSTGVGETDGETLLWIARISAEEIQARSGWSAHIRSHTGTQMDLNPKTGDVDWTEARLAPPFDAVARGALRVPIDGIYRFRISGHHRERLSIDGAAWIQGAAEKEILLARGLHEIELTATVEDARLRSEIAWRVPGSSVLSPIGAEFLFRGDTPTGGLRGDYFRGRDCQGEPVYRQIDQQIGFYFHEVPFPRPFSICWTGALEILEEGDYRFSLRSVDGSSLFLDGRNVLLSRGGIAGSEASTRLSAGWHAIELRYDNESDYAQIYLSWAPPGKQLAVIPQSSLMPQMPRETLAASSSPPDLSVPTLLSSDPGRR